MGRTALTTSLFAAALCACSEYGIGKYDDDVGNGDICRNEEPSPAIDVELSEECDMGFQVGTFTPIVEWQIPGYNGYGPPVAAQLDDDNLDGVIDGADIPDIVFCSLYNGLVALDGRTGTVKWTSTQTTDGLSGLAIGDVQGDGLPEIAVANGPNEIVLYDHVGGVIWRRSIEGGGLNYFLYPSIADMDRDGKAEIIAGRSILSWDGHVLGVGAYGVGANPNQSGYYVEGSMAVAVDLDGDDILEVVVGNAAYNRDGTTKYASGLGDGTPAIADMDLDGAPEIVVSGGNRVWTLESNLMPTGWQDTFTGTNYVGPPAIDDLDGDGAPEFVVVGSSEMRAYEWDGTRLWTTTVYDASGAAGPVLYDFEMDGWPEVVYADETTVRIFNGLDGSVKLQSNEHASATGFETPIVLDVDNDGQVEIVMLHGQYSYGLTVYGDLNQTWSAGRHIWNQHAYSITNVGDLGEIPAGQNPNWETYNNFRSGDAGLPPSHWNDLSVEVVGVCEDDCPDQLSFEVRVWNQGTEDVHAGIGVVARAGPQGPVIEYERVSEPIPSGRSSEGILFVIRTEALDGARPVVEVDRTASLGQSLAECKEDNNKTFVTPYCGD